MFFVFCHWLCHGHPHRRVLSLIEKESVLIQSNGVNYLVPIMMSRPFRSHLPVGTGLPVATHSSVNGLPSGAAMCGGSFFSHSGFVPPMSSPVRTGVVHDDGSDLPGGDKNN